MTKQELIAKVNELIAAPTCNAGLKAKAQAYLESQTKANADALVKSLEENVNSIDEVIAFCESDAGKQVFGEKAASEAAALGRSKKAEGEKFCFCDACQAGSVIYANKENLA